MSLIYDLQPSGASARTVLRHKLVLFAKSGCACRLCNQIVEQLLKFTNQWYRSCWVHRPVCLLTARSTARPTAISTSIPPLLVCPLPDPQLAPTRLACLLAVYWQLRSTDTANVLRSGISNGKINFSLTGSHLIAEFLRSPLDTIKHLACYGSLVVYYPEFNSKS